jgi:hypothetical protein
MRQQLFELAAWPGLLAVYTSSAKPWVPFRYRASLRSRNIFFI